MAGLKRNHRENAGPGMPYDGSGRGYVPSRPAGQPGYPGQMPLPSGPPVRPDMPVKRRKHKTVWILLPVVLLLVVLCIGAVNAAIQAAGSRRHAEMLRAAVDPYRDVFCPGVYVNGIHLGGMSPQEGKEAVEAHVQQQSSSWKVRLTYGSNYKDITAEMMNFTTDVNGVLLDAWQQGHTGDDGQRYAEMLRLQQQPYMAWTARPSGNTQVIDNTLAVIKSLVDRPARDARMVSVDRNSIDDPFRFEDEEYGLNLNTDTLRQQLYQMASLMESGTVEIIPDRIDPAVHKADLMKKYTLRSSAFTKISTTSPENRNNNIRHAFNDFINGYRLAPGETFSFNKVVGERSEARGFFRADEIVSGTMVEGFGGGVCQASTTLYQAAVCAGLRIDRRQPHSEKVKYTDLGLDATVYLSRDRNKDFRFTNTTGSDIYLFAVVERDPAEKNKNRLRARVNIYGEDMGDVEYGLKSVIVETVDPPAPETRKDKKGEYVVYTDDPPYLYSEAQPGYKVDVFLAEKRTGQEIWLYTDEYPYKRAVWYEGVKKR